MLILISRVSCADYFYKCVFGLNKNLYAIFEPVLQNMYTVTFITWFVLLAELLIALAIFYPSKKFKIYMFWLGVFLHFYIAISFGLWSFMFAMIGVLLLALTDFNFKQHPKIVK
ncbi:hypothetical protein [Gelidibacter japonicus]|uniref:hypothetical protein n=1 Tax=Gelidibacter japonicus TaxID=1962232 RepID=UPI003A944AD2